MKTSKIKNVVNTKEWSNNGKTIIYHNLEMENGDKINIGKVKVQQEGWELTYEITEQGQQEFNKSKAVQKEQSNFSSGGGFQKSPDVQKSIVRQSSLKASVELCSAFVKVGNSVNSADVLRIADTFVEWVHSGQTETVAKAEKIVAKADNTDLPF
jgi:hypothetical protein